MQIVVWWCRFSVLIWMQACMVASICRRGRPWPREREEPAPEVWEGFTGQNDYGRQSHPWLNMRIFFHTASSTHLQLWFFMNVLKYNVLLKCNFSRCNTFQHTFSAWCALQMPGMGFRYCRCAGKCYTCSRRIWESHWLLGGFWNHPFPGVPSSCIPSVPDKPTGNCYWCLSVHCNRQGRLIGLPYTEDSSCDRVGSAVPDDKFQHDFLFLVCF